MATYSKILLSGSTNGKPIKVVQTATTGTTIHTAVSGTSSLDEIWIYAQNNHTADVQLTVEFGGTSAPDQNIIITIPYKQGLVTVIPGLLLNNSCVVTAFAGIANVVTLSGYVHRIV